MCLDKNWVKPADESSIASSRASLIRQLISYIPYINLVDQTSVNLRVVDTLHIIINVNSTLFDEILLSKDIINAKFLFSKSLIKAYFNLNWIVCTKYNTNRFMQEII